MAAPKTHTMDMTRGNPALLLLAFTMPLLLGNLCQELYTTVDSIVLGNFVGSNALAAVGTTTAVTNSMVRFFNGIGVGAGVVVSRCFGSGDEKQLHNAVETTMTIAILVGLVVSVAAVPYAPLMLRLTSVPQELMGEAQGYLQIFSAGILFLFVYNMGSFVMRAVGDTRRPLYFLIITSVVNIVLDVVFVVCFGLGVRGTAIATVLSEALSAVMVCVTLSRSRECYRLVWRDLRLNRECVKETMLIGLPTAVAQGLTSFGNAFVQGYVNRLSTNAIAGWAIVQKVDQFALLPMQTIGQAATTYVGQNRGARQYRRMRAGIRTALVIGAVTMGLVIAATVLWPYQIGGLFVKADEPNRADVLNCAATFLMLMATVRMCCVVNQVLNGALRGLGDGNGPMIICLWSFVFARQLYLFIATRISYDIHVVGFGFPFGWLMCSICVTVYYLIRTRRIYSLADGEEG